MQIDVKVDLTAVMRRLDLLPNQILGAAAAALNDTANSVRGAAVKAIAAETGEKQTDIRSRLWIKRATRTGLIAEVGAVEPGTDRATQAYATSGSALYSQHARSNFHLARPKLADAAAAVRLSERQLRDRRKRMGLKKRKSVRPPPAK
jgi:hypothetical protein